MQEWNPITPVMQAVWKQRSTKCNFLARRPDTTASLSMQRHNAKSIIIVRVISLLLLRPSSSRRRLLRPPAAWCLQSPLYWCPMSVTVSSRAVVYLTCFKVVPALHRDLAAIEFALVFQPCLLGLLSRRLPSVAPTEVVKLPERICREHKIPHRE